MSNNFQQLISQRTCTGNIGVVGFCFGGWISNMMAVKVPELKAAVPFYGGQTAAEEVPNINAPLLLHFAGNDQRVNAGWPAYATALQEHNKEYSVHLPAFFLRRFLPTPFNDVKIFICDFAPFWSTGGTRKK